MQEGFIGWLLGLELGRTGHSVLYLGDTEHHLLNLSTLLCVGGSLSGSFQLCHSLLLLFRASHQVA